MTKETSPTNFEENSHTKNESQHYKSIDYLKNQRFKREQEGGKRKLIDDKTWEKYMTDQTISEYQRLEEIKLKA